MWCVLFPSIDQKQSAKDIGLLKQTTLPYFPSGWPGEVNRNAFIDLDGISVKPNSASQIYSASSEQQV